ncbi:MAG: hypothetical protein KatS3mg077_2619 [Candidatus Binatia bacterium]|nr:MAG: hypothetical protein KatS3mg077_2619 [Candidatus Binatia bacterium]
MVFGGTPTSAPCPIAPGSGGRAVPRSPAASANLPWSRLAPGTPVHLPASEPARQLAAEGAQLRCAARRCRVHASRSRPHHASASPDFPEELHDHLGTLVRLALQHAALRFVASPPQGAPQKISSSGQLGAPHRRTKRATSSKASRTVTRPLPGAAPIEKRTNLRSNAISRSAARPPPPGHSLFAIRHSPFAIRDSPLARHHSLLATRYSPFHPSLTQPAGDRIRPFPIAPHKYCRSCWGGDAHQSRAGSGVIGSLHADRTATAFASSAMTCAAAGLDRGSPPNLTRAVSGRTMSVPCRGDPCGRPRP